MSARTQAAVLAAALAAGCQVEGGDFDDTAFLCSEGRCPAGYECQGGRCVTPGSSADDAGGEPDEDADTSAGDDAGGEPDAQSACVCTGDSDGPQCTAAQDLVGVRDPGGAVVCASTASNTSELVGCTGAPAPAADAAYRVELADGEVIEARVEPQGFDASLYLRVDCGNISGCFAHENATGVGGSETLRATAVADGAVYVVVDSPEGSGCYQLTVTVTPP